MKIAERVERALRLFEEAMPVAETELHYDSPFQLLVAVILSAQCTDKRINMVTPALFDAFPTAASLAQATAEQVYELIKSVSYPNNKTRALLGMAQRLVSDFGGEVPSDIDSLMTLPGVGRKTANVMLAVIYDKPAMAVDTHVFRVAERIGFTRGSKNPLQTERALMRHIPETIIPKAHHWLILHGRYVCKARRPLCGECTLTEVCRYFQSQGTKDEPRKAASKKAAPKTASKK